MAGFSSCCFFKVCSLYHKDIPFFQVDFVGFIKRVDAFYDKIHNKIPFILQINIFMAKKSSFCLGAIEKTLPLPMQYKKSNI